MSAKAPPSIDPAVLAAALGMPGGIDIQQALAGLAAAEPPSKVQKTGFGDISVSKAGMPDLSSLGSMGLPTLPTLASLPPLGGPLPDAAPADSGGITVNVSSHKCSACDVEGKLSIYCVGCGHCGTKCNECGDETNKVGALDPGNNMWYCKACWIKNTPEGVEGPFTDGDDGATPSTKAPGANGKEGEDEPETVAAPSANDSAKKAHWAQVFATLQQVGQSHQALEYAQCLRKLRGTIQELFAKYKEALASEDELLQSAYTEALEAYKAQQEVQEAQAQEQAMMGSQNALLLDAAYKEAIDLQVQAHQEVEAHAAELQKAVQGAHNQAAAALAGIEAKAGRPAAKLPRRPGQMPCKFYMRTGDCAYGITCRWDHPERANMPKAAGGPPPVTSLPPGLIGLFDPSKGLPGLGTTTM